jgi:transposase
VPSENGITLPLELAGLAVLDQRVGDQGELVVVVQYECSAAGCPRCGRPSSKLHDKRPQRCRDLPLRDKPVVLRLLRRRFRCLWCHVWTKSGRLRPLVFGEPHEAFGHGPNGGTRRTTPRLREHLAEQAPHQTVKHLAWQLGFGERFVRECFGDWAARRLAEEIPPGYSPKWLGVDEYSLRKGRVYETVVGDLAARRVLASLPGRDGEALREWLEARADPWLVEVATMDMSNTYRDTVQLCLPRAKIVADRFHVVRRVGKALSQVRLRLQRALGQERKGELFGLRYALLGDPLNWTAQERQGLARWFQKLPELELAWQLKEAFRSWYEQTDRAVAERELAKWEARVQTSKIAEFQRLTEGANAMLNNWREEILAFFDVRLTNGFVEGKNNRTKVIQRQAYGYRNVANLRLRVLLPSSANAA